VHKSHCAVPSFARAGHKGFDVLRTFGDAGSIQLFWDKEFNSARLQYELADHHAGSQPDFSKSVHPVANAATIRACWLLAESRRHLPNLTGLGASRLDLS